MDGKILPNELGVTGKGEWTVETAGKVSLSKGTHTLELQDLTGFDGRCDWIEIKSNPSAVVPCVETEVAYSTNDLVVVGGGIAGITTAISAARLGLKVALVQDRPVLGGNNSSEVRVHLGGWQNKAPYPRLGDIVAEIAPKSGGNAQPAEVYEDDRKLAAVRAEKNISLFLNTRANAVKLSPDGAIASVSGVDTRTGRRTAFLHRMGAWDANSFLPDGREFTLKLRRVPRPDRTSVRSFRIAPYIATEDKKEYNNVVLKIKFLYGYA